MQFFEGPDEAIQLNDFEEAVAAYAAVMEVEGENHPLVRAQSPHVMHRGLGGASLLTEVYQNVPPQKFEGDDHATIIKSLETIASDESDSKYQLTARKMLKDALSSPHDYPAGSANTAAPDVPTAPVAIQPSVQRIPPSVNGEVVDGHLELQGFGQLLTALKSARDFAGESDKDTIPRLEHDIDRVDPFEPESVIYWGERAHTIYDALGKAAARGSELHDASAAYMLDAGKHHGSASQEIIADKTPETVAA